MNNMLYIIAGLVVILIVVVLLLIRKKAQEPSAPPQRQDDPKDNNTAATPKHVEMPPSAPVATTDSSATKFDSLTVAQRFMDQQRYDKAIEALERGLIAQPNDSQILLKLLNIYALTDAKAEFNSTFALITAHGDSETIKQAQNLKGLIDEELEQEQVIVAPTQTDEDDADYSSLDFDLPIAQTQTAPSPTAAEKSASIAASKPADVSITSSTSEDAFDLILDDLNDLDNLDTPDNLEDSSPVAQAADRLDEPDTIPTAPVMAADKDMPVADSPVVETPVPSAEADTYAADNIDDDFNFNFDDLSEDASTADTVTDTITDTTVEEASEFDLSEDAFVLDFDDLTAETEISTEASVQDTAMEDTAEHDIAITAPVAQDSLEDDFTLFLDDAELDAQDEPAISSPSTTDAPVETSLEEDFLDSPFLDSQAVDNDITNADSLPTENLATEALETDHGDTAPVETPVLGSSVEDTIAQLDALTLNDTLNGDIGQPITDSEWSEGVDAEPSLSEPALEDNDSALTFDDDAGFENLDFSFDADTEAPVTAQASPVDEAIKPEVQQSDIQPSATVPVAGISPQFSADFDFIKTLNSQQVTLDLAEQYLQLGEYDSAKRLLNEVVTQGNSDQQQQAKALLARTA